MAIKKVEVNLTVDGDVTADAHITNGGASTDFVKGDGILDSNTYDNYQSWNLKTNNVQRTTVQSGGDLDIVGGTDITVAYSAGGVVTINNALVAGQVDSIVAGDGQTVDNTDPVNPIITGEGLEKLTETTTGWRLIGSTPANFGNIGSNSVDLSISNSSTFNYGATGTESFAAGLRVRSSGNYTFAAGVDTIAASSASAAFGWSVSAVANYSFATGLSTYAANSGSIAMGRYNVGTSNATVMEIGIGYQADSSTTYLFNGLEVYGVNTNIPNNAPALNPHWGAVVAPQMTNGIITAYAAAIDDRVLLTKEYGDAFYLGIGSGGGQVNSVVAGDGIDVDSSDAVNPIVTSQGLETINEGNGIGFRLIGRDATDYANIGYGAIDFSEGSGGLNEYGATAPYSFVVGSNNKISSSSPHTVMMGSGHDFSGAAYSTALGANNTANIAYCLASGSSNSMTGGSGAAIGVNLIQKNFSQSVFGNLNVGLSANTIFEIGIGYVDVGNNKHNGLEVYGGYDSGGSSTLPNWGAVVAPEMTNQIITDFFTDRVLITKEYADANYSGTGGSMSSFNVAGDTGTDQVIIDGNTLEIVGDGSIIDTVATVGDVLTINHSTAAGNKHIPAAGTLNQWLKWSAIGTAIWADLPSSPNTWRPVTAGGNTLGSTETLAFTNGTGIVITESAGAVTINTALSKLSTGTGLSGNFYDGSTASTWSLNYSGTSNFINASTNAESTAIATTDVIAYSDSSDSDIVKRGLVSDLPLIQTSEGLTKETGSDAVTGFYFLTQAEYDALTPSSSVVYFITSTL